MTRRMAELFKTSQGRLGEAVHRYASGDPSVSVAGTPYIRYVTGAPIRADMNYVIKAVASAARTTPDAVLKRGPARELAIQLATQVGITRTSEIQSALGISALTVSRTLRGTPRASALTAALRVLSDPRLLKL